MASHLFLRAIISGPTSDGVGVVAYLPPRRKSVNWRYICTEEYRMNLYIVFDTTSFPYEYVSPWMMAVFFCRGQKNRAPCTLLVSRLGSQPIIKHTQCTHDKHT